MRPPAPVSKSQIQICVRSVGFDVHMSCFPSGEKRGRSSWFGVGLSRRESPPRAGTIHKCEIFLFGSRSTSSQSNTTHFPSGDGTGAPTRLSFIMSSKVNGCLPLERPGAGVCARSELVSTRLTATKTFISGNGLAEFADMQRVAYASPFWGSPGGQPVVAGSLAGNRRAKLYQIAYAASRQAAEMKRLAAYAPQSSAREPQGVNYSLDLRAKRFANHLHAQPFDALKLIVRALFQLTEITSLQCRKIRLDRGQRSPQKLLAGNSERQSFQRLKQLCTVVRIPDFYATKFLGQPRTGLAHGAFLGSEFPNQIAQRFLIGLNLIA